MPYPEFWFWLKLFLSTLFTGLLAWYSYKSETTNSHRTAVLSIALVIVFLSFWNSCEEHHKAQIAEDNSKHDSLVADIYRRRAENLAITNLSASYDIKDSLVKASTKAVEVLTNTDKMLSKQTIAGNLLMKQADSTRKVLINSRQALLQINKLNNPINQLFLRIGISYKLTDDKNFDQFKALSLLMTNSQFKFLPNYKYDIPNVKGYGHLNAVLSKKFAINGDSSLYQLMLESKPQERTIYNDIFPDMDWVIASLFKNTTNNKSPNKNANLVFKPFNNTIEQLNFMDHKKTIYRYWQNMDFEKGIGWESIDIPLVKTFSDNTIVSSLDLKGGYMLLNLFMFQKIKLNSVEIHFGDSYSNVIFIKPADITEVDGNVFHINL